MKKLLTLLLIVTVIFTSFPVIITAENETQSITAYVNISKHGEFLKDINENDTITMPVYLTDGITYTLDDLFRKTHEQYCSLSDGYSSSVGDMGAYITKFWGDESGNFGYQVNGATESVAGLSHEVEDGDIVDVVIYKNLYPDTEAYTKFDKFNASISLDKNLELVLYEAGYDENWNTVFNPCKEATITINGADIGIQTDENGRAIIKFDNIGTHTISAYKNKNLNNANVPAITAPLLIAEVTEPDYMTIIHNIAQKYTQNILSEDMNMVWFIADICTYNELYPDSPYTLSAELKQSCLDKIIASSYETNSPSTLAKNIIALRALGYDARNVYNSNSEKFDVIAKLTALVDEKTDTVTNIYTLPYVMIALSQHEEYITEEQMNYLLSAALSSKESWQNNEWGTDAACAMLLALAPYYNKDESIKEIIDETITIITSSQTENGLIGNAASSGIAAVALSALNIDSATVKSNETSLIDGLMSQKNETLDGFKPVENTFSTEQGFRGLLAWQLLNNNSNHIMYDFSSYPLNEAISTKAPVFEDDEADDNNNTDNDDNSNNTNTGNNNSNNAGGGSGSKKPVVEKPEETEDTVPEINKDFLDKNPDVKVMPVISPDKTFADILNHKNKKEIEFLAQRNIINGKSETSYEPNSVMTRAEFATIITRGLGLPEQNGYNFNDVSEKDWYYSYINTAFHYGIIKGVSQDSFDPNGVITKQEAAVMIQRASKLCGIKVDETPEKSEYSIKDFKDFSQIEHWAKDAVAFCYLNNILSDETKTFEISPAQKISRGDVALMVYNMLAISNLLEEKLQ